MKRRDLISKLEKAGCQLLRHGSRHDINYQPETGRSEPVARHREIHETLAGKILKSLAPSDDGR